VAVCNFKLLAFVEMQAKTFEGREIATVAIPTSFYNSGLAVDPDHNLMAVCNSHTHMIAVYSLDRGDEVGLFGGYGGGAGRFKRPSKLCFNAAGNILVVETENKRIQEVTPSGTHVRCIGIGKLSGDPRGIAANSEVIVVSDCKSFGHQFLCRILVFENMGDYKFLREFHTKQHQHTRVKEPHGLRISPDGLHLIVAECGGHCVSVFRMNGEYVKSFGRMVSCLQRPQDVCILDCGELVVTNTEGGDLVVFSSDGREVRKRFGSSGIVGDLSDSHKFVALATCRGRLYALASGNNRVKVFE
jgi:DNA-binding beta-propeller fold protein YncE